MDAARLLPVLGLFLFMLPPLFRSADGPVGLVVQYVYVFGVWMVLIVGAFLLSRRLREVSPEDEAEIKDGDAARD